MKTDAPITNETPAGTPIAAGFAGVFLSQGYILLGSAVITVITARLGPGGRGEYVLTLNLFSVLSIAAGLGLGQANVFFAGKNSDIKHISANSILAAALGGLSGFGAIALFGRTISGLLHGLPFSYLLLIGAALPFQLTLLFLRHIFLGRGQVGKYNLLRNLELTTQLCVLGLLLVSTGLNTAGAIASAPAAVLVSLAVAIYLLRGYLSMTIDTALLRRSLSFGAKAYLSEMAQFLNLRLDMFLVAFFLDVKSAGYYSVAVAATQILANLPQAAFTVLFSASATSSRARMDDVAPQICRLVATTLFAFATATFLFAGFAIPPIFGAAYTACIPALRLLLPGIVAVGIHQVLYADLAGRGRPEIGSYASLTALVATVALDFLLIPKAGIEGAAIASSIAYCLGAAFILLKYVKLTNVALTDLLVLNSTDIAAVWRSFAAGIKLSRKERADGL